MTAGKWYCWFGDVKSVWSKKNTECFFTSWGTCSTEIKRLVLISEAADYRTNPACVRYRCIINWLIRWTWTSDMFVKQAVPGSARTLLLEMDKGERDSWAGWAGNLEYSCGWRKGAGGCVRPRLPVSNQHHCSLAPVLGEQKLDRKTNSFLCWKIRCRDYTSEVWFSELPMEAESRTHEVTVALDKWIFSKTVNKPRGLQVNL